MILGVGFPALCLLAYELWAKSKGQISPKYLEYQKMQEKSERERPEENKQEAEETETENRFSIRVIGIGIAITGLTIVALGVINPYGRGVVITVGGLLAVLGMIIYYLNRKKNVRA